ncbi:MAG: GGDEF domain-containing protein [Syntrophomonadaceae bacterium]|nr:GGDEF domain-containing protein [Syntrophomonadaceae bacterium]
MGKGIGREKRTYVEHQKLSMIKFINRVKLTLISSIFIVTALVFFLVYQPMQDELKKSLTENFVQISLTNYYAIENNIERCIEGAKSLSSRTMIKNAIGEYKNGKISLEELKTYTQAKYEDGAKAIDYIVLAERIVDDNTIAIYQIGDVAPVISSVEMEKGPISEVISKTVVKDERIYTVVYSPISIDNKVVGYDHVIYDLTKQIKLLCTKNMEIYLADDKVYQELLNASVKVENDSKMKIIMKDGLIYSIAPINNMYFVGTQKQSILYQPIFNLAKRIIIGGTAAFVCIVLIIYFYIIRYAKKELGILELSRNAYKQIAYIDHLTGAYSRQFLDIWDKSLRSYQNNYAVVMIDVDDFKRINDSYGHATGDKVLQQLATTILKSIRQSDLLIRYGGDEFVLVLSDIDAEFAQNLITRIESQLSEPDPIQIKISYGISMLTDNHDLKDSLNQADSKMYEVKAAKKAAVSKDILN